MTTGLSPLAELEQMVRSHGRISIEAEFDVTDGDPLNASVELRDSRSGLTGRMTIHHPYSNRQTDHTVRSLAAWFGTILKQAPGAQLRFGLIRVKFGGGRAPMPPAVRAQLAEQGWFEARGEPVPGVGELRRIRKQAQAGREAAAIALLTGLGSDPKAVAVFNRQPGIVKRRLDLRGLDLAGLSLDGVDFSGVNLRRANLAGASLVQARFSSDGWAAQVAGTRFDGANLTNAWFAGCEGQRASFRGANLVGVQIGRGRFTDAVFVGADLSGANLRGSQFSGADFHEARFEGARFNVYTGWPAGFVPPSSMIWEGPEADPRPPALPPEEQLDPPTDLAALVDRLRHAASPGRIERAVRMLRADRFQLFDEVHADHLVGVVRSLADDDLVFSCRLDAGGRYDCRTPTLSRCGGLRGQVCTHILVLLLGLVQADRLSVDTAYRWIVATRGRVPGCDREMMAETLLRFRGAEAGEVDWRPTETIAEDFLRF